MARPARDATVRRFASTHGISWSIWNVSHCERPSLVLVSLVVEAAVVVEPAVRHDHDQGQPGSGRSDIARGQPIVGTAAGAMQEVEHRVVTSRVRGVAVRQQDAETHRTTECCGRHVQRVQPVVDLLGRDDGYSSGVAERRRVGGRAGSECNRGERRQGNDQRDQQADARHPGSITNNSVRDNSTGVAGISSGASRRRQPGRAMP